MSKISLTIDKNYCSDWKVFAGCRELLQNAKDADEDGYKMSVEHYPRTSRLEISNAGVYVDPARLLILGKSDKVPGSKRGQFGEGFTLGCLALVRQGFDVKFVNGDLSWGVSFEEVEDENHPFAGNELLTFRSRKMAARETDFRVEVSNITTEIWDALKTLFLFLEPAKLKDTVQTSHGTMLLDPAYKGQVFSRGIFVRTFDDLACGYDMNNLELDRDRRFVDEWALHYKLGAMWQDACHQRPELAGERIYDMAKANSPEGKHVQYHADAKLLKNVRDKFEKEHGTDAVPVGTMAEARDVEGAGGKPTMVSAALKELLNKGGLTAEGAKKALEGTVEARFSPYDLVGDERRAVSRIAGIMTEFVIVTFKGDKPAVRLIDDDKVVGIDRRLLGEKFSKLLKKAVAVEAQRRGCEPVDVLLDHVAPDDPAMAPALATDVATDCEECGASIPDAEPFNINKRHKDSCSLYPAEDATEGHPF